MPQVGEVKRNKHRRDNNIWQACVKCGKERWVRVKKGNPVSLRCRSCANRESMLCRRGDKNPGWKGGRINVGGYVAIKLQPDDFFYPMANQNGYVKEHRLVMAKKLGRCLLKSEQVHHRPDVAKDDNREEVLYLMPNPSDHSKLSPCSTCELKKEIRLLRWQVKELLEKAQGRLV